MLGRCVFNLMYKNHSEENTQLKEDLQEKTKAVDVLIAENQSLKSQLDDALEKLRAAEAENKNLIDRWMLEKMKDAEKLNEVLLFG
jgi:autophagy-related protein 16-1